MLEGNTGDAARRVKLSERGSYPASLKMLSSVTSALPSYPPGSGARGLAAAAGPAMLPPPRDLGSWEEEGTGMKDWGPARGKG